MKLVNERIEKDKHVKEYSRDGKDVHVVVKKLVHDETPQPKKPQLTDRDKLNYIYFKMTGVIE